VLRALAACAGLILAGFHAWLFGQQAWTGQLETATSLRWLLAFGLVAALVALHRRGASLWGRRAIAVWLLAALLHGPSLAAQQVPAGRLLAETSDAVIQIAGAALGVALALTLSRGARGWQLAVACNAAPRSLVRVAGPRWEAFGDLFLPRPPPLA
jgi:hypothetical protein